MNRENTLNLFKKYPELFPKEKRDLGPMHTLMCFGFECGDGWYQVIDNLCQNIQEYIDNNDLGFQPEVVQVKEKFGGLRFYITAGDDKIYKMIDDAESVSDRTCEICGNPGKGITVGRWMETRCKECYEKEIGKKESSS